MMQTCASATRLLRRRIWAAATMAMAIVAAVGLLGAGAQAAPSIGEPAPAFTETAADGTQKSLSDYAGKIVVLEWTNHDCPFVRKHYDTGNMQALQERARGDDIVWLTVISSAPGEQGHVDGAQAEQIAAEAEASPSAILLDPDGTMGRAYDAKTTPHMYVIDRDGRLVFMGGIDDRPTTKKADVKGANNHVAAALEDLAADRPVKISSTRPYGCSIKYSPT